MYKTYENKKNHFLYYLLVPKVNHFNTTIKQAKLPGSTGPGV